MKNYSFILKVLRNIQENMKPLQSNIERDCSRVYGGQNQSWFIFLCFKHGHPIPLVITMRNPLKIIVPGARPTLYEDFHEYILFLI